MKSPLFLLTNRTQPMLSLSGIAAAAAVSLSFTSCVPLRSARTPNMGMPELTAEMRNQDIDNEPTGNFYYGRRYFVEKTRFWGYVRRPRQPWSQAQLVVMNESQSRQPDRLPEAGPADARHGMDQNAEYRLTGSFTGRKIYEPASNLFLPEFKASQYAKISNNGGWLFTPSDHYDKTKITLVNASVAAPKPRR